MYRILCIEDSLEVQLVLKRTLAPGYQLTFYTTLEQARRELASASFDLLILDIGLPDGDGLRFCAELKTSQELSSLPVFILTANHSIHEKTLGFQLGIEDFIVKPFEPLELRLRIDSRLKKITAQKVGQEIFALGNLSINFPHQSVTLQLADGDVKLEMSTTEFKLLSFLARNKEQVKSRAQILTAVWGEDLHLSDRTIDSHLSRMRKKLQKWDHVIEAVPNAGYRVAARR